jgi:hypothetical protein
MTVSTAQLATHLQLAIDWQRFTNLANSLGDQLNDAQWRFFKAIVFENSMETYSDGSVRYVGEEGCDLIVTGDQGQELRVEMKYTENALYTPKGSTPRAVCQSITLMNSKGTNTHKALPANYADYLLVVGLRGAALVNKATLSKYAQINGDSITAQIPTSEMEFVFTPSTVGVPTVTQIDLREELAEAVRRTIAKVQ